MYCMFREKERIEAENTRRMTEMEREIARVEQFKVDKEKAEAKWREQVEALSQGMHASRVCLWARMCGICENANVALNQCKYECTKSGYCCTIRARCINCFYTYNCMLRPVRVYVCVYQSAYSYVYQLKQLCHACTVGIY